jgi:hypothetical protein
MSEDTKQLYLFKEISGKEVHVNFSGGKISSDSGIVMLRECIDRLGIIKKVAQILPDDRHPAYIDHSTEQLLNQRVLQIIAGYEDGNDCDALRNDPAFKTACSKRPESDGALASQPTMFRFEHRIDPKTLIRLGRLQVDFFISSYKKAPGTIILDFDDTEDETYGSQQLSLFNGYYGSQCYQPMHIYEGQSGKLIATILRPGKRPDGKEIAKMIRRIVRIIKKTWPKVNILFRGDSHYCGPAVFDICKEHNMQFVLGLTSNNILQQLVAPIKKQAEAMFAQDPKAFKLYHEFEYQAATWAEPQRVIAKIEYTEKLKINIRFIVTSFKTTWRKQVYEMLYCDRGKAELYIKEHKNHLGSDRTSCNSFLVNQFRLIFFNLAYMILHYFRSRHLKNTCFATADFNTIRLRIIKIGAQIKELSTRIKIHLSSAYPYQDEFRKIYASLTG